MHILPVLGSPSPSCNTRGERGNSTRALTSALVPGLGQVCDGRLAAGLAYLTGFVGFGVATSISAQPAIKFVKGRMQPVINSIALTGGSAQTQKLLGAGKKAVKKLHVEKALLPAVFGLSMLGVWIANIVDAYKGSKSSRQKVA